LGKKPKFSFLKLSNFSQFLSHSGAGKDQGVTTAVNIIRNFFSPEVKMDLVKMLIANYLQLVPSMLHLWKRDPEAFVDEELAGKFCCFRDFQTA
jgi:hypothetical protein